MQENSVLCHTVQEGERSHSILTEQELYVLRGLRDSILADRKALCRLEHMEMSFTRARAGDLLQSLARNSHIILPDDCEEQMENLRHGIYDKQRRYLAEQAALEKELSFIQNSYVRSVLTLYFVDLMTAKNIGERLGINSDSIMRYCKRNYLQTGGKFASDEPKDKTLLKALNGFRFLAAQIERLNEKLASPIRCPDFFLPFEEDAVIPAVEVWKEELQELAKESLRLISYIEAVPDAWTRGVLEARFIDGMPIREVARMFGKKMEKIMQVILSYLRRHPEGYVSCSELAERWGVTVETVHKYCAAGRLPGAVKRHSSNNACVNNRIWSIPADVPNPEPLKNKFPEGYLSVRQLAEQWGVTPGTISKYCRTGELPGAVKQYDCRPSRFSEYAWMIPADVPRPDPERKWRLEGYVSCQELAERWGIDNSTVQKYCQQGKLPGAVLKRGRRGPGFWYIPEDVQKPYADENPYSEKYRSCGEMADLWGVRKALVQEYCRKGKIPGAIRQRGFVDGVWRRVWLVPVDAVRPVTRKNQQTEEYVSCQKLAERWGINKNTVSRYCREGKLPGAIFENGFWRVPADVPMPYPRKNPYSEKYRSCGEMADLWGVRKALVQKYCRCGNIPGAIRRSGLVNGKWMRVWLIPASTAKPEPRKNQLPKDYRSVRELAKQWGVKPETIAKYCRTGKLPGALQYRHCRPSGVSEYIWIIPANVSRPDTAHKQKGGGSS